jgi:hypothetical protein
MMRCGSAGAFRSGLRVPLECGSIQNNSEAPGTLREFSEFTAQFSCIGLSVLNVTVIQITL